MHLTRAGLTNCHRNWTSSVPDEISASSAFNRRILKPCTENSFFCFWVYFRISLQGNLHGRNYPANRCLGYLPQLIEGNMLARLMLSLTLIVCLTTTGVSQEKKSEKKKSADLNERILGQVKKALKRFEKELGEEQFDSILKSVENNLNGKANHFEFEMKSFDPSMLKDHLKMVEGLDLDMPSKIMPHIIQLEDVQLNGGKKKRMIGVMLQGEGDGPIKVQRVMKDSAAESAGIKAGDVIVKVNGKKVDSSKSLTDVIQGSKGKVKVTVTRGKKNVDVVVEPKEMSTSALEHAIIQLDDLEIPNLQIEKDGAMIIKGIGPEGKVIELHQEILKDGDAIKKLGSNGKIHKIIQVKPHGAVEVKPHGVIQVKPVERKADEIKKRIELKIDRAEDAKRILRNRLQDDKRVIERRVEIKSDLSETLEKLQIQMKELQKEIQSLKKAQK